jgi:hypothetical protein
VATLRHRYRDALWDSDLGKHELWVALALEKFMSSKDLGGAYPSVETLARLTRLGERTVQRALKGLVRLGWIHPTRPANQHRPTTYQGCLPVTPGDQSGVTTASPRGAYQSPDPVRDEPGRAALLESAAAEWVNNLGWQWVTLGDTDQEYAQEIIDRFPSLNAEAVVRLTSMAKRCADKTIADSRNNPALHHAIFGEARE